MEEQLEKSKPAKRPDNAPIDALRIMLKKQAVSLTPMVDQVSALPVDDTLEYYFIPMQYMKQYAPYHRPGKPFKNFKLVKTSTSPLYRSPSSPSTSTPSSATPLTTR